MSGLGPSAAKPSPKTKMETESKPIPKPAWWRRQSTGTQNGLLVGAVGGGVVLSTAVIVAFMLRARA